MGFKIGTVVQSNGGSPLTLSNVVVDPGDVLVVAVGCHQGTISDVQWNGVSGTKLETDATAFNETAELWYFSAPAPGTFNVVITGAGASNYAGAAIPVKNIIAQVGNNSANGSGGQASSAITPVIQDTLLIGCAYAEASLTSPAPQRNLATQLANSYEAFSASYYATGATYSMKEDLSSGQRWAHVCIGLQYTGQSFKPNVLRPRAFAPGLAR